MKYLISIFLILYCLTTISQIYIPNTFTPNGDNNNDVFEVYTNDTIVLFDMKIYNIQGCLIYHTIDINQAWTGGDSYYAPDGLYLYEIIWKSNKDKLQHKKGHINLIR